MVSKTKRLIFVSALAIAIVGSGMYGAKGVSAQNTTQSTSTTIVQKIAQKFGLRTEEVQAIFDQERESRHKEMEARFEQRLTDAVSNGALTEEKKQQILAKHKEIEVLKQTELENLKNLSDTDRRAAINKRKAELKAWAQENDIDLHYLMGGFAKGGLRGNSDWKNRKLDK